MIHSVVFDASISGMSMFMSIRVALSILESIDDVSVVLSSMVVISIICPHLLI